MQQRLSLVTLGVRNFHRSKEFYLDGLGWKQSPASQDDVCFIQLNGFALGLYPLHKLAKDCRIANVTPDIFTFGGITLAYNTHSKEEVDEVMALALNAGARQLKPAQDTFWGGYAGYFADPDGYPWEIAWNPHFELDEKEDLVLPS